MVLGLDDETAVGHEGPVVSQRVGHVVPVPQQVDESPQSAMGTWWVRRYSRSNPASMNSAQVTDERSPLGSTRITGLYDRPRWYEPPSSQ